MVVLLDLDDQDPSDPHPDPLRLMGYKSPIRDQVTKSSADAKPAVSVAQRANPNVNGFSAALSCYP